MSLKAMTAAAKAYGGVEGTLGAGVPSHERSKAQVGWWTKPRAARGPAVRMSGVRESMDRGWLQALWW